MEMCADFRHCFFSAAFTSGKRLMNSLSEKNLLMLAGTEAL